MDDDERIALQLGRRPRADTRVVARCGDGWPVAVEQPARDSDGAPFPTSYWLTCPGLSLAIGALESAGGVAELEGRLANDPALRADFAEARRRQVALRPELGDLGIGGTRAPDTVKCLHAHAAFAIGSPPYPIGDAIIDRAGGVPSPCCMRARDA
jgi:uncharacterized protein